MDIKFLMLVEKLSSANLLSWSDEVAKCCWYTNRWFSATNESIKIEENFPFKFDCRFLYYNNLKLSDRIPCLLEIISFYYHSFYLGIGSLGYYKLREILSSKFNDQKRMYTYDTHLIRHLLNSFEMNNQHQLSDGCVLYDNDLVFLRHLLKETRNGKIVWKKGKRMRNRKRTHETNLISKDGNKFKIVIKPISIIVRIDKQIKTPPLVWQMTISNDRKVSFIMGTEGYRILEEMVCFSKGHRSDRRLMINLIDKKIGDGRTLFEQDIHLLECILNMTKEGQLQWMEKCFPGTRCVESYRTYLNFPINPKPQFVHKIVLKRYWLDEAINQIGCDPLIWELNIDGNSLFIAFGTECGWYLENILSLMPHYRFDSEPHDWNVELENRIQVIRDSFITENE
jgi:hypothetical protein